MSISEYKDIIPSFLPNKNNVGDFKSILEPEEIDD